MKLKYSFFLIIIVFAVIATSYSCSGDDGGEADINAERMLQFVEDISGFARGINPDFIIIPQNGPELAFINTDPGEGIAASYISAIDGIGIEELFYDYTLAVDNERLSMLRTLKSSVKIMVSDYISPSDTSKINDAIARNNTEGFISFPRSSDNYNYQKIPAYDIEYEPSDNIGTLAEANNYLYLINRDDYPNKQDMLDEIAATNYDVILTDLYLYGFDTGEPFTKTEINALKVKANGKKRLVISYISIGSAENFRYYWKPGWGLGNPSWIKKPYEGWEEEFWVEFWNPAWREIIFGDGDPDKDSYIKSIVEAGFDGVYLDNVEAYYFLVND